MMHEWEIAFRNVLRNRRRSTATVMAVAIACGAIILFGGYLTWFYRAGETHAVCQVGHITIFRKGFYERGAGSPASFALAGYDELRQRLLSDPELDGRLGLVTGQLMFHGLVNAADQKTSAPFIGMGVFPEEHPQVAEWNGRGIYEPERLSVNRLLYRGGRELEPGDPLGGTLGVGLGKILRIDPEKPPPPRVDSGSELESISGVPGLSLVPPAQPKQGDSALRHTVELLTLPPGGDIPNMTTLYVRRTMARATKELDDRLITLPIESASELVFPGERLKVTSVVLLLKRSATLTG